MLLLDSTSSYYINSFLCLSAVVISGKEYLCKWLLTKNDYLKY